MTTVLGHLSFAFTYLDDVLVASRNKREHKQHLKEIFKRLGDQGLHVSFDMCKFAQTTVDFLGFTGTQGGIKPKQDKIDAIRQFPRPIDVRTLRRFLGMLGFYRSCIPEFATIAQPLYDGIPSNKKNDKTLITWDDERHGAFDTLKHELGEAALRNLVHPDPAAKLRIVCDDSGTHIGAALEQEHTDRFGNRSYSPLGFFSKAIPIQWRDNACFDK